MRTRDWKYTKWHRMYDKQACFSRFKLIMLYIWPHELPVDHTVYHKINFKKNVKIYQVQIPHLKWHWRPHKCTFWRKTACMQFWHNVFSFARMSSHYYIAHGQLKATATGIAYNEEGLASYQSHGWIPWVIYVRILT